MSSEKPNAFEPAPRGVTMSKLAEELCAAIKLLDPVEKSVLRASMSGRLGPTSERIQ
jgi:hypothetical protein